MVSTRFLKPYESFILLKIAVEEDTANVISNIVGGVISILDESANPSIEIVANRRSTRAENLEIGYVHYTRSSTPSWYSSPDVQDLTNQLVLAARLNRHIAIYTSEDGLSKSIRHKVISKDTADFGVLDLIPTGVLNRAFLMGSTKTLWLSGIHRRTSIKADNKILTGIDLRDALDPLGDQSYRFTAARASAKLANAETPIGVNPRNSKVWLGPSNNWLGFVASVTELLTLIEGVIQPEERPLPILASPSGNFTNLDEPFDISIIPPEILNDILPSDPNDRALLEKWAYQSSFTNIQFGENRSENTITISADLYCNQQLLGTATLDLNKESNSKISLVASGKPASEVTTEEFEEGLSMIGRRSAIKIWFESGHHFSDGLLFEMMHRDIRFNSFLWADFSNYDIGEEKPADPTSGKTDLQNIGSDNSLFDWVRNHWPDLTAQNQSLGWLACDDGSMEIADFIHIEQGDPPTLSLVHVKKSKKQTVDREISVSDFEIVCAQAIKGLRNLDRMVMTREFEAGMGKKVGNLVWSDGVLTNRKTMLRVIRDMGADFKRKVFVVQPRITRRAFERAYGSHRGREHKRFIQLETLLHGTAALCRDLEAEFCVIGENV